MPYTLEVSASARKGLDALPKRLQVRASALISALAEHPRPRGATPLKGRLKGLFRLRVGDYRIVYEVDDERQRIRIASVGPRENVYTKSPSARRD